MEWQEFALQLVQRRHSAQNVQQVPEKVQGDAGIEYFSTDGCMYQSYAPQETADVAKAASAMKRKASRDLKKLEKNKDTVSNILGGIKISRWILLCPFLDNKEVIASVRSEGDELKSKNLPFLANDFRAMVQSQDDFESELKLLQQLSIGPSLQLQGSTSPCLMQ